jgi:NAD(P)-dependent dehydrogenase (short-subunit alcohol dehydrogenase family)
MAEQTMKLEGKTAVVTGGGTGIGKGIALALAQAGAKVVICGRRAEPLQETAHEIKAAGGQAWWVQADVAQVDDVARVVETAVNHTGTIHILINNAGVSDGGYLHEISPEAWDEMMAINLRAPFLTARAVLPLMRQQHEGHIINISSESGLEYYGNSSAYGVSKHALNALGEHLQVENQDVSIRIDTICPGMVWTPMSEDEPGLNRDNCLYPEDIADLALWLLTRRPNVKIGRPILIQTMLNPWE